MTDERDMEAAWQALSPKQREWLRDSPTVLDLTPSTIHALARIKPPLVEPVPEDESGRAHKRTQRGWLMSAYIRDRPSDYSGRGPRARRVCDLCGTGPMAAIGGSLVAHYTPRGDQCDGGLPGVVAGRIWRGPVVNSSAKIPAPLHELVRATAKALKVECRDIAAEALARLMADRDVLSEAEAREVWRVPEPLRVERVPAEAIQGPIKSVCWSLPASGCDALAAWEKRPSSKGYVILVALVSLYWDRGDGEGSAWARDLVES